MTSSTSNPSHNRKQVEKSRRAPDDPKYIPALALATLGLEQAHQLLALVMELCRPRLPGERNQ
jgi:hypothetical protein